MRPETHAGTAIAIAITKAIARVRKRLLSFFMMYSSILKETCIGFVSGRICSASARRCLSLRCEFCLPRHEIRLGSADVADLKRIHNFWAKLVFCYMELLKYCRNVANVKTFWYNEVVPKNRHPHLRLKHRRADA